MDARVMPYIKRPEKVSTSIAAALASAVLEWFLIFLLFIDASFSYLVTKFARYCHLETPCLLCSRLDHILGKERTGFYWDLICQKHKLKISSLVLCHLHSNLVDVHGMCESCLFSFATINKSNAETYRLLVGKLGAEALLGLDQDPLLGGHSTGSSGSRSCSCCNENWISRGYATELFQAKSIGSRGAELDAPLSMTVGHDGDSLQMISDDTYRAGKGAELDTPLSVTVGHNGDNLNMIRDDTYQVGKGAELDAPLSVTVGHDGDYLKMIRDDTYRAGKEAKLDAPLSVTVGHDGDDLKMIRDDAYRAGKEAKLDAPLSVTVGHDGDDLKMIRDDAYRAGKEAELDAPLSVTVGHNGDDLKMIRDDTYGAGKEAELDAPFSVTVGHDGDDLKMIRDETYRAGKVSPTSMSNFDPLPHVEYKKVKITSDSESEAPISDDESASSLFHEEYSKKDLAAQCLLPEPQIITLADDQVLEKLIHPASVPEPSPEVKMEVTDTQCTTGAAAPVGHGLEELNWHQVENKTAVSASPELISFDVVFPSSRDVAGPIDASGETLDARGEAEQGREEVQECRDCKVAGPSISTRDVQLHSKPDTIETSSQMPNSLDLGDAYKLAVGSRGRQLSGKLLEQRSLKESARASEDFKILLTQLSASRGIEISLTDMSPRVSGNIDEFRASDASSSVGMKILQKRISLERNESGLSIDGSTVSEIEGESVADRLKRQVEHDKKIMSALYQELEEERNASAVAVNQAMAMITRLQEEKAALHMEALQCLRMMEDQAEYDVEALQKANKLLAEKEKEIQDLGAELELYKKKFGPESILEDRVEPFCESILGELGAEDVDASRAESKTSILSSSNSYKHDICNKMNESTKSIEDKNVEGIVVEFEEERLYLLQCLKKLDEKLQHFCRYEAYLDIANGDFSAEQGRSKGIAQQDGEMHEDHIEKGSIICDGRPCAEEGSASAYNDTEHVGKEGADWKPGKQVSRYTDLDTLKNEFSLLSSRLEALETETSFLEHSVNSLKNGDEGLKCINEIASHLRDLHSSISRRN